MGARGRGANPVNRAPHKNDRPGALGRMRAVAEGSSAYWDLTFDPGRHWPEPFHPGREAAWRAWRDKIFARWWW